MHNWYKYEKFCRRGGTEAIHLGKNFPAIAKLFTPIIIPLLRSAPLSVARNFFVPAEIEPVFEFSVGY